MVSVCHRSLTSTRLNPNKKDSDLKRESKFENWMHCCILQNELIVIMQVISYFSIPKRLISLPLFLLLGLHKLAVWRVRFTHLASCLFFIDLVHNSRWRILMDTGVGCTPESETVKVTQSQSKIGKPLLPETEWYFSHSSSKWSCRGIKSNGSDSIFCCWENVRPMLVCYKHESVGPSTVSITSK